MRGVHHVKPHDLLYDMLREEWDPAEAAWQSIIHICPFPMLCWGAQGRRCKLGPKLRAVSEWVIAIIGAEMSPKTNGERVPQW
jgi:hypothetical protein